MKNLLDFPTPGPMQQSIDQKFDAIHTILFDLVSELEEQRNLNLRLLRLLKEKLGDA